jgi:hypothetical protein
VTILIRRTDIEKELPRTWNAAHVALRLAEGFAWSAILPDDDRLGCRTSWPSIVYEIDDLDAQAEQRELERNMSAVRDDLVWIAPSSRDISRCHATQYWPMKYLNAHPHLAGAVNKVAMARAHGHDLNWVVENYGGSAWSWRERHDLGCEIIARGLRKDGVVVF